MAQALTTDERFDKVDAQLSEMNKQLDRIATIVVQGFERIDKQLEDKASKADMQRVYDYLDKVSSSRKLTTTNASLWDISLISSTIGYMR